ncbi:MAG TPA: helix-turn-helix domain-containing protein [Acidimicrobiales bacterium]|nr:helix-turn-helix domain-containing protein [Acidimicrobiales bacterium]
MARPAPAISRTVALMSFLASRPGEGFTLTELARQLDVNKATTHSMVSALVDAGWVLRDAHKQYRLGPALVAIASAVTNREQVALNVARDHMRALVSQFGVRCIAAGVVGDEVVMLAVEGPSPPLGVAVEVGHRVSLTPPLGAVFLAWSDDDTINRWLQESEGDADEGVVERYQQALAGIRRHGFALTPQLIGGKRITELLFELARGTSRQARQAVNELLRDLEREEPDRIITEIHANDSYDAGILSAPVFDASGKVLIALGLVDVGATISGAQLLARVDRLLESTRAITKAINGRPPDRREPAEPPHAATGRTARRPAIAPIVRRKRNVGTG